MRILLAVDGSEHSLTAAAEAGRSPWPAGSVVRILSVAEMSMPETPENLPLAEGSYAEWQRIFEARAVAHATAAAARFAEAGGAQTEVVTQTRAGNPKELILREAETWNADLLLLGTHGYNRFQRMWLGSVSRALAAQAHCSVRIVRPRPNTTRTAMKILLATDGSECSEQAVAVVADRPWPAGSELRILSVLHLPFTPSPETWGLPDSYYSELERRGYAQANAALNQAMSRLQGTPLAVTHDAIPGHAEEKILETARDWAADLILLGSHGRSGWQRFWLGSVSQAVVSHAPCSVEIVRKPGPVSWK
jgi:nucleotide-binding universal stress UspA family protein